MIQHQMGLIGFLIVLLLVALSNLRGLRRIEAYPLPKHFPRVSVLVPARNEANQIVACVRSLLAQDYPNFQLIVLDDNSTDGTGTLLSQIKDSRLTVLKGAALPTGWLGKNWACEQLAQAADGDLLLFTDADTRHHPHALRDGVAALQAEHADLLTAIPREAVVTWGEKLIVPFMSWAIFALLPLGLAQRVQWSPLSATMGPFMLFRREMYKAIGRHAGVRQSSVDDLALGRRLIGQGGRWRLVDAGSRVQCRMYRNGAQASEGFSRHLFAVFGYNTGLYFAAWLWIGLVFIEPLVVLGLAVAGIRFPEMTVELAALAVLLSLAIWAIFCWRFSFPFYLAPLYPLCVFVVVCIAFRSIWLAKRGGATWKGRVLPQRGKVL